MKQILLLSTFLGYAAFAQSQNGCALRTSGLSAAALSASAADISKMNRYDVHYYKLDLTIQNNTVYLSGNATIQAKVVQPISEIVLQLHENLTIDSIKLNDTSATFSRVADVLNVSTYGILQPNSFFKLTVYYRGTAPSGGQAAIGNGFSTNTSKKVTWSLSEPFSAYEWWPCKQVLTDKADSCEVWITTDSLNKAGSNGVLKNKVVLGNGKVKYEWKSRYPIAYYLISVAVCPYDEYITYAHPAGADSILIQDYLFKDATAVEKESLKETAAIIELFSSKFGLYPFAREKYGHTQAVFGGAMEHQTMSTMGVINSEIVVHELGHQWFGDMVTCSSWNDIWISEGFATYTELVALEELKTPKDVANWVSRAMSLAKNASESVYVTDSLNPSRIFDYNSTYQKGAILLRMLRFETNNDSLFFAGLRNYLQANRYNTAGAVDFKWIMEQVLGKSLTDFFNQWYYNPGYPILSGQWNQWNEKLWLQLNQQPSEGSTVFKTPINVTFKYVGGDTTIRIQMDAASKLYLFNLPGKEVYTIRIDEGDYILNEMFSMARNLVLNVEKNTTTEFTEVVLYPNPVANALTISGARKCRMQVVDVAGKEVAAFEVEEEQATYNMSSLPAGMYIVRLSRNGAITHRKFLKN
jgi:aminopeptidase N